VRPLTVSCRSLMPLLREALCRGSRVRMAVSGSSMRPFLRDGDRLELVAVASTPPPGEVVLAEVGEGVYLLHRIAKRRGDRFWLLGDAQVEIQGPLPMSRLIARAVAVERRTQWIRLDSPGWRIAGWLWARLRPWRSWLLVWGSRLKRLHRSLQSSIARLLRCSGCGGL